MARQEARRELAALRLKLRLLLQHWRAARKAMARQQLLIRDLGSDLEAARRQSRQQAGADAQQANAAEARTRQLLLQLEVTGRYRGDIGEI